MWYLMIQSVKPGRVMESPHFFLDGGGGKMPGIMGIPDQILSHS